METITFTVGKRSNNYGGLYDIKTKHTVGKEFNYTAVENRQLFDVMNLITTELNSRGYAVLFEIES